MLALQIKTKVWLECGGAFVFGDGGLELLDHIQRLRSLTKAARSGWVVVPACVGLPAQCRTSARCAPRHDVAWQGCQSRDDAHSRGVADSDPPPQRAARRLVNATKTWRR